MVGECFAVVFRVVGDLFGSEGGVHFGDCGVGCSGDGEDRRDGGVEGAAEGEGGFSEDGAEDEFVVDGGWAIGEEQELEVSFCDGSHPGCDLAGLLDDFRAEGKLDECAAVAHQGVWGAASGSDRFECRGLAGFEAEAAGDQADVGGVAEFECCQWGWGLAVWGWEREAEGYGRACSESLWGERYREGRALLGLGGGGRRDRECDREGEES